MSEIFVDTIKNKAGSTSLDSDKLPDMYSSSAKAYFSHSQTAINQSFNISSIEDLSAGNVRGYYTNAMSSSTNPLVGGNNNVSTSGAANYSTGFAAASTATYYWVEREYANGTALDMSIFSGAALGDLA